MTLLAASAAASEPSCYSRLTNDWFCAQYVRDYQQEITDATIQHLGITIAAVLLSIVIAFPLALVARRLPRLETGILGTATAIYTIPSLALYSLLVPVTGLGVTTVVIGLGLYSLTILVRNILEGLRAVPAEVRESAIGMGYAARRMLWRVEVPLALPAIMAGLRVATVSAVALTTVGAILDYGGLGDLLVDGTRTNFKAQVLATSLLCVLLAVCLDLLLVGVQRLLTPWTRTAAAR